MSKGQIPGAAVPFMEYALRRGADGAAASEPKGKGARHRQPFDPPPGYYVRRWSSELVEHLTSLAAQDERINPSDYPYAAPESSRAVPCDRRVAPP